MPHRNTTAAAKTVSQSLTWGFVVERVTGIEPARPAWKVGRDIWGLTRGFVVAGRGLVGRPSVPARCRDQPCIRARGGHAGVCRSAEDAGHVVMPDITKGACGNLGRCLGTRRGPASMSSMT